MRGEHTREMRLIRESCPHRCSRDRLAASDQTSGGSDSHASVIRARGAPDRGAERTREVTPAHAEETRELCERWRVINRLLQEGDRFVDPGRSAAPDRERAADLSEQLEAEGFDLDLGRSVSAAELLIETRRESDRACVLELGARDLSEILVLVKDRIRDRDVHRADASRIGAESMAQLTREESDNPWRGADLSPGIAPDASAAEYEIDARFWVFVPVLLEAVCVGLVCHAQITKLDARVQERLSVDARAGLNGSHCPFYAPRASLVAALVSSSLSTSRAASLCD